jgi:hypothetical protein
MSRRHFVWPLGDDEHAGVKDVKVVVWITFLSVWAHGLFHSQYTVWWQGFYTLDADLSTDHAGGRDNCHAIQ